MKGIRLDGISVRFGRVQALSKVDLEMAPGQITMLVGPNGAGKSTLMRVLLGLVRPQEGRILVDGEPRRIDNQIKARVGYLPEAVAFSENLTGRQVLRFFALARGVSRKRVREVIERIGLTDAERRAVRGYSRGMRQRLGLGAAILSEPEILILDEPTLGLDQEGLSVLWGVLDRWREAGRMVLLAAHDMALLERRVDKMCVLRAGRVVSVGSPEELRQTADLPHRVHMVLAEHANGDARALVEALERWGRGSVERHGQELDVTCGQDALLELMDVRGQFRDTVVRLRVEEPSLEVVYERLLEEKEG